jgi:hypothetical protein
MKATFTKTELDKIMRDVRREHMENIRNVSIERDQLKKDLKKCEKKMTNTVSDSLMREYNSISKKYERCQEEVNLLKMMNEDIRRGNVSIVPIDNRVMNALIKAPKSPKGKRPTISFLSDISNFNKSILRDVKNKPLSPRPDLKRKLPGNFLQGISNFDKSALRKSRKVNPTPTYLKKMEPKPKTFAEQLSSKFANIRPPSDDESDSDVDAWGLSTKRQKSKSSRRRRSKTVRRRKSKTSKRRKSKTSRRRR